MLHVLEGYTQISVPLINGDANIHVPGSKLTSSTPDVFQNNAGVTHLKLGENFHLEITEQRMSIDQLISDLNQDIFYKSNILSQSDNEIVYEKTLPDGSSSFVHFCKVIQSDDHDITIKSANTGHFRKSHIERMMKSANSFTTTVNKNLLSATPK